MDILRKLPPNSSSPLSYHSDVKLVYVNPINSSETQPTPNVSVYREILNYVW